MLVFRYYKNKNHYLLNILLKLKFPPYKIGPVKFNPNTISGNRLRTRFLKLLKKSPPNIENERKVKNIIPSMHAFIFSSKL